MTTKMPFTQSQPNVGLFIFLVYLLLQCGAIRGRNIGSVRTGSSASISSVLIFGDSTADSGNNNFIRTPFKSNFSPYGRDFPDHTPTGRFSNGRLANDFLADYIGLKRNVPPYLDPTLTIDELITGVTFASAGSGFDPLTPTISNVIQMSSQLDYFKEYRGKLEAAIGKEKTKEVISNAVYFVSAGTNDFVVNYFSVPIRRRSYAVQGYTDFVISEARQFVQALYDEGARRIGVVGLPAMGCLPIVITLYSDSPILKRDCVSNFSSIARDYNQLLQKELNAMQLKVADSGARIVYFDAYSPLEDMALGRISGFDVLSSGCCGTGMVEASFLCNSRSTVCNDATKYVYFDSIHPTEKTYELLFQTLRPSVDLLIGK